MNRISTIIAALLLVVALRAGAQIKVEVSETVELMGILSRTAGFPEYNMDLAGQYTADAETWFAKYKDNPVIAYYQGLREKDTISFGDVSSMAIHLDIDKGKVSFLGEKSDLEKHWHNVDIDEFVARLNQFYADTHFHDFFEQHRAFYDEGVKKMEPMMLPLFRQEWFAPFYGTDGTERFRIILSFTHGGNNNGVARQLKGQPREQFAICGYIANRKNFDATILVHEFSHPFVNPLLDNAANAAMIEKAGRKLFQLTKYIMEEQAYDDWRIVINESIVRAAVFVYLVDNKMVNDAVVQYLLNEMYLRGFRWMPELVVALREYSSKREQYKTLNDFYPEIARCLNKYADDESGRIVKALK